MTRTKIAVLLFVVTSIVAGSYANIILSKKIKGSYERSRQNK